MQVMQVMQVSSGIKHVEFRTFCSSNKRFFLHLCVIIILWAFALANAACIIIYYQSNNFSTFTKTVQINDTFPFLNNVTILINYDQPIFRDAKFVDQLGLGQYQQLESLLKMDNFNSLTTNSSVDALRFFNDAQKMDSNALDCFLDSNSSCPDLDQFKSMDSIFSYPKLAQLAAALWDKLSPYLARGFSKVVVKNFTLSSVSLSTDLSNQLTIEKSSLALGFGITGKENPYNLSTESFTLEIRVPQNRFPKIRVAGKSVQIHIKIKNMGMYDNSVMGTCDEESKFGLERDECIEYENFNSVKELCNCVPFSYEHFLNSKNISQGPSFCTADLFETCLQTNGQDFSNAPSKCSTEPCLIWKNDYQFFIDPSAQDSSCGTQPTCADATIIFECADQFYLLYQSKTDQSICQLLAEIGGAICLYTGFSLLGFWQLVSCVLHLCRQRRKASEERSIVIIPSWSKLMVQHMEMGQVETDAQTEAKKGIEKLVRDVEHRMKMLQQDISSMTVSLGSMQSEIWKVQQDGGVRRQSLFVPNSSGHRVSKGRLGKKIWLEDVVEDGN